MKRGFLIIGLLFLLIGKGNAGKEAENDSLPPFPIPEMRLTEEPKAGALGALSVNSSGFTTAFYRPFVRGGFIDKKLKQETLKNMEERNRFGGDRTFSVGGSYRPDSLWGEENEERSIFFRVIDGRHYHASFTRDLFRTLFIGNAEQEERAELGPFRVNSLRYRQFKIGMIDRRGDFELGIAISGFQGLSDVSLRIPEAYLETDRDPSALRFRLKGNLLQQERKEDERFWRFAGTGAGLDILSGYDLGRYGRVRFSMRNMGLIHWGPGASIRQADTSARFDGFDIGNPLEGGTNNSKSSIQRLEDQYLHPEKKGAYRRPFPGELRLSYSKRFPSEVWFRSILRHRPFTPFHPYFGLEIIKRWRKFRAGLTIGYGGFGELAFGWEAAYRFGEKWDLYLRAPHLEGVLLPKSMGGVQAALGLHYNY